MFEKIRMMSYEGNYLTCQNPDELEQEMKEKYGENKNSSTGDVNFQIIGKASFILGKPVDPRFEEELLNMQSFSYLETRHGYFTRRKNYASYLLCYTYKGEGELEYLNKTYKLKENDLFLIDCRLPHSYKTTKEIWNQCGMHFFGGNCDFLYEQLFSHDPLWHMDYSFFQNRIEELLSIYNSNDVYRTFLFSLKLTAFLLDISKQGRASAKNYPESIEAVQNYLDEHFTQDISLNKLSEIASLSKYYLLREYKKYTGVSPKEYATGLRMNHASMLLMNSDIPSYKIGLMVGYKTEALFISQFKKTYNMTPGEYRRVF